MTAWALGSADHPTGPGRALPGPATVPADAGLPIRVVPLPMDRGGHRRGWSPGMVASFALHAGLIAAFTLSITWTRKPREMPEIHAVEVSLVPGEGDMPDVPKVAAPERTERPSPVPRAAPPSEAKPDAAVEPPSPSSGETQAQTQAAGQPAPGGLIWTPPAPRPDPAVGLSSSTPAAAPPPDMPTVKLGKGASDPVLVSFDEGRWSDPASISEARSLASQGRITMSVAVDAKGAVTRCDVVFGSGSASFDARGCQVVSSYVYQPAKDAAGRPHAAIVSEVLEWSRDGTAPPVAVRGDARAATPTATSAARGGTSPR